MLPRRGKAASTLVPWAADLSCVRWEKRRGDTPEHEALAHECRRRPGLALCKGWQGGIGRSDPSENVGMEAKETERRTGGGIRRERNSRPKQVGTKVVEK